MQILAAFFLPTIKISVPMLLLGDDAAGVRQKDALLAYNHTYQGLIADGKQKRMFVRYI